jgi:phosphoglucosamine mutase
MKLVVDAAHGAAYQVAPNVFHELGAEVTSIGVSPDGLNINKGFGATHPQALVAAVTTQKADYGIALDGDADRLQLVDASGRLFNGDELLYLMVAERIARGEKPVGVVGTLMTNKAVEMALRKQGIEFVRAKVGDRYVLEELDKRGWLLGGEGSGHLLALDRHTTGDGIVSALQVLQACVRSGKTVAQLLDGVTLFPQTLVNVRIAPGQNWKDNQALASETERMPRRPTRPSPRRYRPRAHPRERHRAAGARDGRGARRGAGRVLRPWLPPRWRTLQVAQ